MALGEIFKNARIKKGLSLSNIAEQTHMMVQIVECLEREDFRRIAAPIYGRGFVKLYAECLDLDPEPLVRDFMAIYDGARMPTLRVVKSERPGTETLTTPPVTRTVTGPTALTIPERETVQSRPSVRPLGFSQSTPQSEVNQPPLPVGLSIKQCTQVVSIEKNLDNDNNRATFVVEPEEACDENVEPDLFKPRSQRLPSDIQSQANATNQKERASGKRFKLPIFKIGRNLDSDKTLKPVAQDEATHARHCIRVKAFMEGVVKLKGGLERKLPHTLPSKQFCLIGGMAVIALTLMICGIRVLFKMTESATTKSPTPTLKQIVPPPDLYVD